jgi:hypothetical protein
LQDLRLKELTPEERDRQSRIWVQAYLSDTHGLKVGETTAESARKEAIKNTRLKSTRKRIPTNSTN